MPVAADLTHLMLYTLILRISVFGSSALKLLLQVIRYLFYPSYLLYSERFFKTTFEMSVVCSAQMFYLQHGGYLNLNK